MNYAELSRDELIKQIRELQSEGVDAVYLDREDWNILRSKLLDSHNTYPWKGNEQKPKIKQKFFQYRGMKFFIVEEMKTYTTALERTLWRAYEKTFEVQQSKGGNIDYEV